MESTPLDLFERPVIKAVADAHGMSPDELESLIIRHHNYADSLPGIEELVYDWRQALRYDPLILRTPDCYLMAFDGSIWDEFGAQMKLGTAPLDALRDAHTRQARKLLQSEDINPNSIDNRAAMVLAR